MGRYLNPFLTVAQVATIIEEEGRKKFGNEFERMYRTFKLQMQEQTTDEEQQVFSVLTLVGTTSDQTSLFLALMWLAKHETTNSTLQEMLELTRKKTLTELMEQTRKAAKSSS